MGNPRPPFRIWTVDDRKDNIEMIEDSFSEDARKVIELRSFTDAKQFIKEIGNMLRENRQDELPDFVLLDFFLGSMYGSEVLVQVLELYNQFKIAKEERCVIIGHSSNLYASQAMVKAGADFLLPKIKGRRTSRAIERAFSDPVTIRWTYENRQPMIDPNC